MGWCTKTTNESLGIDICSDGYCEDDINDVVNEEIYCKASVVFEPSPKIVLPNSSKAYVGVVSFTVL